MNYAVVNESGTIINRVVLDRIEDWHDAALIVVAEGETSFAIGGTYMAGVYTPPPPTEPEPMPTQTRSISDRQFFQQLAVAGIISEAEALASNAAVIPAPLLAIINQMPAEEQFAAKMLVSGATVFERHHPMTEAIGTAYDWSVEQIDAFFIAAADL